MMELKLRGLDPNGLEDFETSFMLEHLQHKQDVRYAETVLHVSAMVHAGKVAAGGDPGDSLSAALRHYKNVMFPDVKVDLEKTAREKEDLLRHEYEKGPLKVQSLNYGSRKKKPKR